MHQAKDNNIENNHIFWKGIEDIFADNAVKTFHTMKNTISEVGVKEKCNAGKVHREHIYIYISNITYTGRSSVHFPPKATCHLFCGL